MITRPDPRHRGGTAPRPARCGIEALEGRVLLSAGTADPSYGRGGQAIIGVPTSRDDSASAVAVTAGGQVLVGGSSVTPDTGFISYPSKLAFARFTAGGAPDGVFSQDGKTLPPDGPLNRLRPTAFVRLRGGRHLVALVPSGDSSAGIAVARLNADGTLDAAFGEGGVVVVQAGALTRGTLSAAPDGWFVVVNGGAVERFTAAGTPAGRFAEPAGYLGADAVAVQPDGRVIVAGGYLGGVRRFLPDGTPDKSFAGGAVAPVPMTSVSRVMLTAGGRVVVAGHTTDEATGQASNLLLRRLTPDGRPDAGFGGGRTVDTGLTSYYAGDAAAEFAPAIAHQPDGGVVVLGGVQESTGPRAALVRLTPEGARDAAFGTRFVPAGLRPAGLATGADGSVFVAASKEPPLTEPVGTTRGDFVVLRYSAGGRPDPTFGGHGGGRATADFRSDAVTATAAAKAPGGKTVVAGYLGSQYGPDQDVVLRLNADGSPDPTFGVGGVVRLPASGYGQGPAAVAVRPDGKVIVGSSGVRSGDASDVDFVLTRLDADGTLDEAFGSGGRARTDLDDRSDDTLRTMVLLPDGKILAAGGVRAVSGDVTTNKFGLVRYHPDGTPDATFGRAGRVRTPFAAPGGVAATALVPVPGGGVLAVGPAQLLAEGSEGGSYYRSDYALAKYLPDGRLDAGFGAGGKVQTGGVEGGRPFRIVGALPAADGGVVVGTDGVGFGGFGLARFSADGELSKTFGPQPPPAWAESASATAMVGGADGSIYVGGSFGARTAGFESGFVVARFRGDTGAFDPTFGFGTAKTLVGGSPAQASVAALLPDGDGHLLAVGSAAAADASRVAVVRYATRGAPPVVPPPGTGPARLVRDFTPGASSTAAGYFGAGGMVPWAGGVLLGLAGGDPEVSGLWRSDGTDGGTVRLSPEVPQNFLAAGSVVLFNVSDEQSPAQLWRTDGSAAGTYPLGVRAALGGGGSVPAVGGDGTVYFGKADGDDKFALWRTDGTVKGTRAVTAGLPSEPGGLSAVGSRLFFSVGGPDGSSFWVSDGTTAGTRRFADVGGSVWATVNGKVLFRPGDPTGGDELWVSDGTPAGTTLLKDIRPGPDNSYPDYPTLLDGRVYFKAYDGTDDGLWATDGTPEGTVRVVTGYDKVPPQQPVVGGGRMFYVVRQAGRHELWASDGTAAGTGPLRAYPVPPGASDSDDFKYAPADLHAVGDKVLFTAVTAAAGRELWVSDGTAGGTGLLKDVQPGPAGSTPEPGYLYNLVSLSPDGSAAVFAIDDGTHGTELWGTDGTTDGTRLVGDLQPGPDGSAPDSFAVAGGNVFFWATDDRHGRELWVVPASAVG